VYWNRLGYLGFEISPKANEKAFEPVEITNIANMSSKPILVVLTDEAAELAKRTEEYIKE
jgi:acetate kinase